MVSGGVAVSAGFGVTVAVETAVTGGFTTRATPEARTAVVTAIDQKLTMRIEKIIRMYQRMAKLLRRMTKPKK